jgi:hypothetical protein
MCIALSLVAAGCGAVEPLTESAPVSSAPVATEPERQVLYEANATVLEDKSHGPSLCTVIASSLPPQCGDVPITNWDWARVEGEESLSGTTWGAYHVAGTYDGDAFTIVEVRAPEPEPYAETDDVTFVPACDSPSVGRTADEGRRSDLDAGRVEAWATRRPTYVASWVTYLDEPEESSDDMSRAVLYNVVVNGDAASMEAGTRGHWDGPLCVVERDAPTLREARRIRAAAEEMLPGLGLQMLGSDEGDVIEAARIEVVADPGARGQAAMDDRFGPGLVRVVPKLVPAE